MNAKQKSSPHISPDPDLPEITDDWIAGADLYHGEKLVRRGRPKLDNPRQLLSLRLPPQTIARWKASGPGWQTRMADALEKSAPKARSGKASDKASDTHNSEISYTPMRGLLTDA